METNTNTTRKQIAFHMDIPEEKFACEMIDKVRYFQTAFIAKLANDFFKKHGLSTSTPYKVIQNVVRSYIDGVLPESNPENMVGSTDNAVMMLLQMQTAMMQQLNSQQMSLMNTQHFFANQYPINPNTTAAPPVTPVTPLPNSSPVELPVVKHEANNPINTEENSNPKSSNDKKNVSPGLNNLNFDLDDDEEIDNDLKNFVSGFNNMLS